MDLAINKFLAWADRHPEHWATLPGVDVGGVDAGHFEQAGAAHPGELEQSFAADQKVQEPQVANTPGDLQKPRTGDLEIGLHRFDNPAPVR